MVSASQLKPRQVRNQILHWIRDGKFVPGDRLPSERQLASELGMCHLTVRSGLSMLCEDDIIEKRPRTGSFVKEVRTSELVTQIAMVLPRWLFHGSSQHPAIGMLLKGVSNKFNQRDYSVIHMVYDPEQLWIDAGQPAVARGIKGMLLWPHKEVLLNDLAKIRQGGIEVVTMMQPFTAPQMSLGLLNVCMDVCGVLSQMLGRLVEMGHRRIAVTLYTEGAQAKIEKNVLEHACQQWNLGSLDDVLIQIGEINGQADTSCLDKFFDRHPNTTAVIAYDEFLAGRLFQYCYQRHIRVPDQLSVLALNDNTPNAHPISLTAPDTPHLINQVGHVAAQYLTRLINGETISETEIKLRCDVQWKGSVMSQKRDDER
jgi:GntR family transcriptional regulator of arabinose operon